MGNFFRKIERQKEKEKQEQIKKVYGRKPKGKCPKCGMKSLFHTNQDGVKFCIRCDKAINLEK